MNHAGLKSSKDRKSGNLDYAAGLQIAASKQQTQDLGQNLGKQVNVLKSNVRKRRRNVLAEEEVIEISHPCLHEGYRKEHSLEGHQKGSSRVILVGRSAHCHPFSPCPFQ